MIAASCNSITPFHHLFGLDCWLVSLTQFCLFDSFWSSWPGCVCLALFDWLLKALLLKASSSSLQPKGDSIKDLSEIEDKMSLFLWSHKDIIFTYEGWNAYWLLTLNLWCVFLSALITFPSRIMFSMIVCHHGSLFQNSFNGQTQVTQTWPECWILQ